MIFRVVFQVIFQAIFFIESGSWIREAYDREPLLIEDRQAEIPVFGSFKMVFRCIRETQHPALLVFPHSEPYEVRCLQRGELHIVYNVEE